MVSKFFELKEKQTNVKIEFVAGLTTFLTMAYIIFANPDILSETGMDKEALIAVTCIVTAVATLIVGVFANAPIAMAPGMGLNAFFAYSLVLGDKISWETALGVVFLSGLFFLLLTVLGLRKKLVEAIPSSLVSAISVGIGLFITFIGLKNLGVIVQGSEATLVKAGELTPTVLIGFCGLLVMLFLEMKKIKGALLIGIMFSTILAAVFGYIERPAELVDESNRIKGLDRLLGIDAAATMIGALLGTSTTTSYIESAAGIEQGGRSGLTSVVTGVFFLLALVFVPIVEIVPKYAAAPALIMVGLFMMKEVKRINFMDLGEAFPAFIIMVMIALSYSISKGLAFGFISFALIKIVSGKAREIRVAMWIIAVLSLLFLMVDRIPYLIEYLKGVI